MITTFAPIYDNTVSTVDTKYDVRSAPNVDPRLSGLSDSTRHVIHTMWQDDVDEACYQAERQCQNFRNPPAWAIELVGIRKQFTVTKVHI